MHTRYCTFGGDLDAQSVLIINKISASELSRKFIKCVVGRVVTQHVLVRKLATWSPHRGYTHIILHGQSYHIWSVLLCIDFSMHCVLVGT